MDEKKKLFLDKNHDYGDSYIKTGKLLNELVPEGIKLNTWKDHCEYQILIRKMDKLIRYINVKYKDSKTKVNECLSETLCDDALYCFMLAQLNEEKEDSQ